MPANKQSTGSSQQSLASSLYYYLKSRTVLTAHLLRNLFSKKEISTEPAPYKVEPVKNNIGAIEIEGGTQKPTTFSKESRRPSFENAKSEIKPKIVKAIKKGTAKSRTKAAKPIEGDR